VKHVESDGRDVPQECGTPSAARKAGFAAVMQRLASRSEAERAVLAAEAEGAVLGYEAYALGQEYLERGNWAKALQWLRVAVRHRVPGADGTLAEAQTRQAADRLAPQPPDAATRWSWHGADAAVSADSADTAPTVVCGQNRITAPTAWRDWPPVQVRLVRPDPWAAEQAAARAAAERITTQARREAAELLGRAQQQAEAALRAVHEQTSLDRHVSHLQSVAPAAIRLPVGLLEAMEQAFTAARSTQLFCSAEPMPFSHERLVRLMKSALSRENLGGTPILVPLKPGTTGEAPQHRPGLTLSLGCTLRMRAPLPHNPYGTRPAPPADVPGAYVNEFMRLACTPVDHALWIPWGPATEEAGADKSAVPTEHASPAATTLPVAAEGTGCRV
jgi:hypothetical protein